MIDPLRQFGFHCFQEALPNKRAVSLSVGASSCLSEPLPSPLLVTQLRPNVGSGVKARELAPALYDLGVGRATYPHAVLSHNPTRSRHLPQARSR